MNSIALLLILGAIGLHFFRKRRVFQRTNSCGIENFKSHSGKISAHSIDWILKFGSLIFLVIGVLILSYQNVDSWGWLIAAPAMAFVLFVFNGL